MRPHLTAFGVPAAPTVGGDDAAPAHERRVEQIMGLTVSPGMGSQ